LCNSFWLKGTLTLNHWLRSSVLLLLHKQQQPLAEHSLPAML
jgi:hypothetical protein